MKKIDPRLCGLRHCGPRLCDSRLRDTRVGDKKLGGPKLGGPILGGPIRDRYCNEFMNFTNNYKELILLLLYKLSIFKE